VSGLRKTNRGRVRFWPINPFRPGIRITINKELRKKGFKKINYIIKLQNYLELGGVSKREISFSLQTIEVYYFAK